MPASLELVKLALKAYGDGYCEISLGMADPLIRWDERASRPDGELVWKQEDVRKAMRRYLDSWQSYEFHLEDVAEVVPGKVVGICRERGVDADGVTVDRRFGGLWVVEDAKIVSWSTYLTPKEAVRAAKELGTRTPRFREPVEAAAADSKRARRAKRQPSEEERRRAAKARAKLKRERERAAS